MREPIGSGWVLIGVLALAASPALWIVGDPVPSVLIVGAVMFVFGALAFLGALWRD